MSAAPGIRALIERDGPIPFDWFMERALYEPGAGFFAQGRGPGRAGRDFVTSPQVGPLFGLLVARALDGWWRELGEPDPFVVIDAGAGTGALARSVLRAQPACAPALRYVMVERSAALRAEHRHGLDLEPPDEALGPFVHVDRTEAPEPEPGTGPIVSSLEDLPAQPFPGVVIANELLDNLPFGIARWMGAWWDEIRVGLEGEQFVEVAVPLAPRDARVLDSLHDTRILEPGTEVPVPRAMQTWLARAASAIGSGFLLVIDYAVSVADLGQRPARSWLRTYADHHRGDDPLVDPGSRDITADVVVEQLDGAARAAGWRARPSQAQADWLRALGIDELVAEGRAQWEAGAHRGDLDAVAGRSRAVESAALCDPTGLGGFLVAPFSRGVR